MRSTDSGWAEQTWLIYALGGGLGHLHRSLALANAIAKRNSEASVAGKRKGRIAVGILTNSPFAAAISPIAEATTGAHIVRIPHNGSRDETITQVHDALVQQDFDALIVDTFPRGLGGELPGMMEAMGCPKVLVHRSLNSVYADRPEVVADVCRYDSILIPGEDAAFESLPQAHRTAPWLIRDRQELLTPQDARKELQVNSEKPVIAVLGCGKQGELDEMRSIACRLADKFQSSVEVRFVAPLQSRHRSVSSDKLVEIRLWPFMKVLRGVTLVVGSGGYNTVHETSAVGVKLVGLPRKRMYDSQAQRLPSSDTAMNYKEVERAAELHLATYGCPKEEHLPKYENGVHDAVVAIEASITQQA